MKQDPFYVCSCQAYLFQEMEPVNEDVSDDE